MNSKRIMIGSEERALLLLSGLKALPGAGEALAAIASPERFVWLANEHGVAGFVKRNLKESGLSDVLPSTEYQNLRNQSFKSIARNAFIMTALNEAALLLNKGGIVPVLLKGTALEVTVYEKSGLRPMTDADILLPKDDCLRAWNMLKAAGFKSLPYKSPLYKLIPLHIGKHLPSLIKGGFSLEIHHSLFWGKGQDVTNQMIKGATGGIANAAQQGAKAEVVVPPAGLHFLYLVSHLVKHELDNDSQLRLYNDLAAIIAYYPTEMVLEGAMESAPKTGMEVHLRNKLGLLRKYMGVELPEKYHFEPSVEAEESFLRFLGSPKNNEPVNKKAFYRETVGAVPGLHRKLVFITGDISPGFKFMKKRYGKRTILGVVPYYFYRLGKLTWLI